MKHRQACARSPRETTTVQRTASRARGYIAAVAIGVGQQQMQRTGAAGLFPQHPGSSVPSDAPSRPTSYVRPRPAVYGDNLAAVERRSWTQCARCHNPGALCLVHEAVPLLGALFKASLPSIAASSAEDMRLVLITVCGTSLGRLDSPSGQARGT